jgi:uncharacterized membrane protein
MKRLFDEFKEMDPPVIGAICGFLIALLLVIFKFWGFMLILLFTLAGYAIGKRIFANKDVLREFLDKLFPPGRFR